LEDVDGGFAGILVGKRVRNEVVPAALEMFQNFLSAFGGTVKVWNISRVSGSTRSNISGLGVLRLSLATEILLGLHENFNEKHILDEVVSAG
jgi:hypothetical protein